MHLEVNAYNSYGVSVHIVFDGTPTDTSVENITTEEVATEKVLKNGQLLIIRNGKIFNVVGQSVK